MTPIFSRRKTFPFVKCFAVLILLGSICCQQRPTATVAPYDLVPHNAFGIVQINDFIELQPAFSKNPILSYWKKKNPTLETTLSQLTPKNPMAGDLYIFSPQGKETFATTYIGVRPKADSLPLPQTPIKNYEGISIHKRSKDYFEARVDNLRLRSTTLLTLENSIRNFKQKDKNITNTTLSRLRESLNNSSAVNLLIQPSESIFDASVIPHSTLLSNKTSEWVAMDIAIEDPVELDGISLLNDSIASPINLIQKLEHKSSLLPSITPDNVDEFLAFPISNIAQLETNFRRFSQLRNMALPVVDLRDIALVDELGWIRFQGKSALLMHITTLENEFPLTIDRTNQKTYRNTNYFEVVLPETIDKLSKAAGKTQQLQWVAQLDTFAVFAETETLMQQLITNYRDGNVLANRPAFQSLDDAFSSRGSFIWVAQTSTFFDATSFPVKTYPLVGLQGVGEEDFTHLHIRFGSKSNTTAKGRVTAQSNFNIDHPIQHPPQWLKNHRTKGMDIAVQDSENQLYLFSNNGNLYWKKNLKEPIIGPILQVDLYKNKKWQMAFRTSNYLYVLDRNGKEVKPFKIKLPASEQPLPLAIFDYDKTKNYRFVLAQDKKMLMFDKNGKKVSGFKRTKLKAPLMHPPKHARIKKKDYILLQGQDGQLSILNRVGNDRIKVGAKINFSETPVFQYLETFTTTDMEGNLVQVDTRGNIIKSPYGLKPGHQIDATSKSLVSLSENILTIKGIPVPLPFGTYTTPKIFYLNNILYITTTDIESQKVYLYYSNGTPVAGFPVYGTGPADLSVDRKNKTQLVVSAENNGLLVYTVNP